MKLWPWIEGPTMPAWLEEDATGVTRVTERVHDISERVRALEMHVTLIEKRAVFRSVEALLHDFPVNELARNVAWTVYHRFGEREKALEQIAVLLALDPDNPNPCKMLLEQLQGNDSPALTGAIGRQMTKRAAKWGIDL